MKEWGRLLTAMVTPFTDGELDLEKAEALARHLRDTGTTAIVAGGTTGEAPTLSFEEKEALFKFLPRVAGIPVLAGVGTNSTSQTIKTAEMAAACGVDGLMVVVPYYNRPDARGVVAHFKAVAAAVNMPLMVYNVPSRTGTNLDAETIIELAKIENIVALKEATGDFSKITRVMREAPDLTVYSGDDALTLPYLAIGAYGVVSVAAHLAGKLMREMIDAFCAGKWMAAAGIHRKLEPLFTHLFMTTSPAPVKAALSLIGIEAGPPRLPLVEAGPEVKRLLQEDLTALGQIL